MARRSDAAVRPERALVVVRHQSGGPEHVLGVEGREHASHVAGVLAITHPRHGVAKRQMTGGFGGLLSFLVQGGAADALGVAGRLRVILRATSLGGIESVIEHRFTIEGPATGVPENLLRLSVGIEDAGDLIADLAQALA